MKQVSQTTITNDYIEERLEPVTNTLVIVLLTKDLTNLGFVCRTTLT